jgi:glucans biosynthesis protein C
MANDFSEKVGSQAAFIGEPSVVSVVSSFSPEVQYAGASSGGTRDAAIDYLRLGLTALVIFHHVAIAYGGSGSWYWRELPNASSPLLSLFNAVNQSYFMGFFFLLAGYYTPASFERKGSADFIKDRLLRLGVPLLVYFFVLSPLTIALARTSEGFAFWPGWWDMMRAGAFDPGPLWFAEALLLFSAAYLLWRSFGFRSGTVSRLPRFDSLVLIAISLGGASFAVRLAIPAGKQIAGLQLGYFPCYIFLFAAGCRICGTHLLQRIRFTQGLPWMLVSLLTIIALPVVSVRHLVQGNFAGGWSSNALFYAMWDPFVACGAILGLLWLAQKYASRATPLTAWLARNAYGAYIVHPPIVVGTCLVASTWAINPPEKFLIVGVVACLASLIIAGALRALPGVRRIL